MCIPPSKRITTIATVTMRWSVTIDSEPRAGKNAEETDAATRNSAGLGTCSHDDSRLEPIASSSATAATTTTRANGVTSCIGRLSGVRLVSAGSVGRRRPDFPAHR